MSQNQCVVSAFWHRMSLQCSLFAWAMSVSSFLVWVTFCPACIVTDYCQLQACMQQRIGGLLSVIDIAGLRRYTCWWFRYVSESLTSVMLLGCWLRSFYVWWMTSIDMVCLTLRSSRSSITSVMTAVANCLQAVLAHKPASCRLFLAIYWLYNACFCNDVMWQCLTLLHSVMQLRPVLQYYMCMVRGAFRVYGPSANEMWQHWRHAYM